MLDLDVGDLVVLRAVAQRGSFTAAAAELGYTQSAISRRVAALEHAVGRLLLERDRTGARLTDAGEVMLRHATAVLGTLEAAERELGQAAAGRTRPVRVGAFGTAMAGIVPEALVTLDRHHAGLAVTLREMTSADLVRALRSGTLDLALLAGVPPFRPVDDRSPPLTTEVLAERELLLAVGHGHRLAGRRTVTIEELAGETWVAARSEGAEHVLGVWPGLAGAPHTPYVVRDWLTKLRLVAAGVAITTISAVLAPALPPDVRTLAVTDGERERRRLLLVHTPGDIRPEARTVADALRDTAATLTSR